MMPDIDREQRRKKRAPVIGFTLFGMGVATALVQACQPGWQWVPLAVGTVAVTAVGVTIDPPVGRVRSARGRGDGLSGLGRDDAAGPAGVVASRRHMLVMASRLTPRSAGRRWLAEVDSLLSEITPARRAPAVRSYLLSAPRLAVMMWAREALRRPRPGPRRPG
jgi:hypothetical protein